MPATESRSAARGLVRSQVLPRTSSSDALLRGHDAPTERRTRSGPCPPSDLAALWHLVSIGRWLIVGAWNEDARSVIRVEAPSVVNVPPASHVTMLHRVLIGESHKAVAFDLKVSQSTLTATCSACLSRMTNESKLRRAPVLLVMAAHAAQGLLVEPELRVTPRADSRFDIETAAPDVWLRDSLTTAERRIVRALLDGKSYAEIAQERGRSIRTIANQVSSVFRKLGVSGRGELVSRIVRGPTSGLEVGFGARSTTSELGEAQRPSITA